MDAPLTHRQFLATLPPDQRAAMTRRSDAKGLRHLAGHLGMIAVLALYVALGLPLWGVALLPLGVTLAFLFTLQHECTHRTPFASLWLNEIVGHAAGLILVQPFLWFRAFHMAHHKHTNDPDNDPELEGIRPRGMRHLAWHLSTLGYWRDKGLTLWSNATGPSPAPYLSDRHRAPIRREARLYLLVYAMALLAMLTVAPVLFWIWLAPLALGFPILRLYLLAEHDRCPNVTNMFANSRTTLTTKAVRFLAWNMPFHAEHHAWPTVPFHKLPQLHTATRPHLETLTDGYTTFTRETLAARN